MMCSLQLILAASWASGCCLSSVWGNDAQVCCERNKDTVITTCWHTFCGPCIKKMVDSRQRNCPGCQTRFGAGDVKTFYLT